MNKAAPDRRSASHAGWLGLLVAVSAAGCFIGLGRASLWIDETHSFEFAALPSAWLVLLNAAARDAYPPLYFLLLHGWTALGAGEVWLRASSVLCHLATIPLLYLLGRRLVSPGAGLVAAGLLAVSPFHLTFAREVRMYPLLSLLAVGSMLALDSWRRRRDGARLAWLAATGLALLYTHFMGVLVLAAQAAFFVQEGGRDRWRSLAAWGGMVAAGFLPWSPFFAKAFIVTHGYGAEAPVYLLAYRFAGAAGGGFEAAPWFHAVAAATLVILAAAGLAAMPPGPPRRLLFLWALIPVGLELVSGLVGKPVFSVRTLISSTPACWLLGGAALAGAPRRFAAPGLALAGACAGLGIAHLLGYGLATAPSHGRAMLDAVPHLRAGDAVVHSSTVTYHALHEYYLPRIAGGPPDFLVEPPGPPMRGGRAGGFFRNVWRKARGRLDPDRVLRTGEDPHRLDARAFLARGYPRVWYFRTTRDGERKLWRQAPSAYYDPGPARLRETPFGAHRGFAAAYRREGGERTYPGLVVELYRRR